MNTNRRKFLKQAGVGLVTAYFAPSLLSCTSTPTTFSTLREIGLQLYTLRDQLTEDASGTIARIADTGYDHVETFGPQIGEDGKVSFWGLNTKDLTALLEQNSLKTHSGHYVDFDFLTPGNGSDELLKAYIDTAAELGQRYLIFPVPPMMLIDQLTSDDYRFMADQLNKGGQLASQSGIQIGYHNHFWEFRTFDDGSRGLDILIENTDKDLVIFELDLFWTEKSGVDSVDYFTKYPGRFPLWHIKDMDKNNTNPVTGPDYDSKPAMEIASAISYTEVGSGSIDFKSILAEETVAGLQYAYVEQDIITIDPFESVAKSYHYVRENLM